MKHFIYQQEELGFRLSLAQSGLEPSDFQSVTDNIKKAHAEMIRLEEGAIKNPDEGRQVTHFTDRQSRHQWYRRFGPWPAAAAVCDSRPLLE